MRIDFIDNTDPDGIAAMLRRLAGRLPETLCVVASKSGGTPETRNGMLLVADAFKVGRPQFSCTRRGDHDDGFEDGPNRHERAVAGPVPDVRLGRRPDERIIRRRPSPGGGKDWTSTACSPGGGVR